MDDPEPRRPRLRVEANVDWHPLATGPVPVRQFAFEQVSFQPCRLVLGVADDGLDTSDAVHHL